MVLIDLIGRRLKSKDGERSHWSMARDGSGLSQPQISADRGQRMKQGCDSVSLSENLDLNISCGVIVVLKKYFRTESIFKMSGSWSQDDLSTKGGPLSTLAGRSVKNE